MSSINKKLFLRKAHRYIALIVSVQLLAWTIGGIWFTWNDIDDIHGDYLRKSEKTPYIQPKYSIQSALNNIDDLEQLTSIQLTNILNIPVYRIKYNKHKLVLVNADNGDLIGDISKQQAIEIAHNNINFEAEILSIELLKDTNKHHEYRGKPLPAWAITYNHPDTPTFYISTKLGTLTSVRHSSWRVFDFLWMLHTMDYEGRDDFGNWLIKIFSLIALFTALSGIVLFFISRKRKHKV